MTDSSRLVSEKLNNQSAFQSVNNRDSHVEIAMFEQLYLRSTVGK